ncbi:hypothetical protein GOP47_0021480 [Adiantum capillus-veneris]|uniref:Adenylyl cyclase-associated protein n=1 Tax=Adiantum capillus-veneris TaxID=13818 RepID=A0A9D4Z596_ADICA|nr:hypothetical protein GOP47_0021480 [Adiantum capillus-veneris]
MADLQASLSSLVQRLEAAVSRLEKTQGQGQSASLSSRDLPLMDAATSVAVDASVSAFDSLIETHVGRVLSASQQIGGQILQGSQLLKDAFFIERSIVLAISKCKQPDTTELQKLLKPLGDAITKGSTLTDGKRTDAYNHLKVIVESLAALTWVAFMGKDTGMSFPATHVEESWQAAEFYNNKVLVEFRNKDASHVEWAKSIKELYVPGLRDYTKKFHATGPAWNAKGISCSDFLASCTGSAPKPTGRAGPPPPPPGAPPPLPPMVATSTDVAGGSRQGMNAVFKEISKGEAVTSGLKKVTADMKTKNRTDRSGAVPAAAGLTRDSKDSAAATASVKVAPTKFELQMDRKWVIENQIANKDLVINKCNAWQSVYIFGCRDCVIQINGKVNNITLDKCRKTGVVFKDVVSAFEVVNCTSVEVQCQNTAPSISVDNTTGCQIYLSKNSLGTCITTAKSSEINVLVPGATENSDLVEHALAEQFQSFFRDGSFITTPVSHSGG